jgi:hypothetical protein
MYGAGITRLSHMLLPGFITRGLQPCLRENFHTQIAYICRHKILATKTVFKSKDFWWRNNTSWQKLSPSLLSVFIPEASHFKTSRKAVSKSEGTKKNIEVNKKILCVWAICSNQLIFYNSHGKWWWFVYLPVVSGKFRKQKQANEEKPYGFNQWS